MRPGNWAESLTSTSGQAESLSSIRWMDQIASDYCPSHIWASASTCLEPCVQIQSWILIPSSVAFLCTTSLASFSFIALAYCSPPSSLLWSGILFWSRKPFMLKLEYKKLQILLCPSNSFVEKFYQSFSNSFSKRHKIPCDLLPCQPVNTHLLLKERSWSY